MLKRALMLGLVISSLICSGYSYVGESSHMKIEVSEDYVAETEELGTVRLDGKYIKMPCEVRLFMDLGYSLAYEADSVFPAESESYGVRLYDEAGRCLTLFVRNDDSKEHAVEDCMAWAVVYKPSEDREYGFIDFAISGVSPDSVESDMVAKLGLPGSNYDFDDTKYALWSASKDEYTVAIDYSSSGIIQMKLTCDPPAKELKDTWWYSHEEITDSPYDSPSVEAVRSIGKGVFIFGTLFLVTIVAIVILCIRLQHKRRMAEIDLAILNTPVDEIPDGLEEKYKV